jgi:hypothetical protein
MLAGDSPTGGQPSLSSELPTVLPTRKLITGRARVRASLNKDKANDFLPSFNFSPDRPGGLAENGAARCGRRQAGFAFVAGYQKPLRESESLALLLCTIRTSSSVPRTCELERRIRTPDRYPLRLYYRALAVASEGSQPTGEV